MASPATPASFFTERYRRFALVLLVIAYIFNFVDRSILSILQESIKEDLGLFDWQLGLLTGFAFALFYATLGIPIAALADRHSRAKIISAAIFVWSLMTALCGAATGFVTLLIARVGVGVGEAGCSPPAHSLISDLFEPKRRATALAIYALGIQLGIMVGFLAGGWINQFFGWRLAFVVVGLPGILFSLFVARFLKEPPRGLSEQLHDEALAATGASGHGAAAPKPSKLIDVFKLLWSRRSFRHLSFGAALHAFVAYGVGGFMPPFYIRSFGLSSGEVGTYLALLAGVIGGFGVFLGGWLGDRLAKRDRRWYVWICALSLVFSVPFSVMALLADNPYLSLSFYVIPAFLSPIYNAPNFALTQGLVPLRMRAAAAAVLLFILNFIGMGFGPPAVGILSDFLRSSFGDDSLRYALLCTALVNLWGAAHYLLAARTLRQELDLAAASRV